MNLVIGKPKQIPDHSDQFKLSIKYMFGDADGYETDVVYFDEKDRITLGRLLDVLYQCTKEYPHGRGGNDYYNHVEGWDEFFGGKALDHDYYLEWANDPISDYQSQGSLEDFDVTYFDSNNVEYECSPIL